MGLNGPCLICVPVYNYGMKMWEQGENDKANGGHAMTIVGYNKFGFIIRNSWVSYWADEGHCLFPYEDWGKQWEVWTSIDEESKINYKPESDHESEPEPEPEP